MLVFIIGSLSCIFLLIILDHNIGYADMFDSKSDIAFMITISMIVGGILSFQVYEMNKIRQLCENQGGQYIISFGLYQHCIGSDR